MTSAQRAAMRRHKRRMEAPHRERSVVKHGVCLGCGRRRELFLPAKLCDRCCEEKT